jgi:O-antigen/teichoic acid export membrane protein
MRTHPAPLRTAVLHGLAWNLGYQVFASLIQFGAMLVVVRIISPMDYGHWVVTLGILQLLNAVNIANFISHALQLPAGQEPDWTLHWHVGNVVQCALFLVCTGVATVLWRLSGYREVSVLLLIASIGLLFNTSAHLRMAMLQRELEFRRLRTLTAISSLISAGAIVLGAMAGLGARALVLGGNVLVSIPLTVDLLLVCRWRPRGTWLAWPELRRYRESLIFGTTRVGSLALSSSRGALTAVLLPATLGYGAIGLMNRAESLFAMSAGRIVTLLSETVYPVLPQLTLDRPRFARTVRGYSLLVLTLSLAGVGFFAACGADVSRVLYGMKWIAADPLLLPGALVGLAVSLNTLGSQVLLAQGRLKDAFILAVLPQAFVAPAFVGATLLDWSIGAFYWSMSAGLLLAGLGGLFVTRQWMGPGAWPTLLAGPAIAAAIASTIAVLVGHLTDGMTAGTRAGLAALAFALAWFVALRIMFRDTLDEMLAFAPKGAQLRRLLGTERT